MSEAVFLHCEPGQRVSQQAGVPGPSGPKSPNQPASIPKNVEKNMYLSIDYDNEMYLRFWTQ